jgi:glucose/arabinose dehydrogenase
MKFSFLFIFNLSFVFLFSQNLELELLASGFNNPVNIKHAGDGRLFIVEQNGVIRIIEADGSIQDVPFLDINDRVINTGNERGLLGLAFHPDYATNGYFFVNYINNSGNTVISRFTKDTSNSNIGDQNSELIILTYNQPFPNHNGGDLAFGPEGYLYISSGDGGSGGDPQNNAQNTNTLLGKILRIDVDNTTPTQNYSIPADNPFISEPSSRGEIWAYGLRNPWKFSFDSSNGDLWIADVGQNENEEINKAPGSESGINYGWRCYEGSSPYNTSGCPSTSNLTFPISEYSHFNDGTFKCSITGGYIYRGSQYPNFTGLYFFADYCSGEIGTLEYNTATEEWDMTFEQFSGNWTAFGEDVNGEIFVADIQTGNIYKLVDTTLSINDSEANTISIFPNPAKHELNIQFSPERITSFENVAIYNMQGKIVKTVNPINTALLNVNTSELASGFYVLQIKTKDGELTTHKLVIN